jgi:protein phosphatase
MTVVRSGAATDVGRVRTVNQDIVLQTSNLFAVADGMGGHVAGEVAAKLAVDTLKAVFGRQASTEGLEQAVSDANAAVWAQGHAVSDLRGMGTTLTAAALVVGSDGRDKMALANVGDSRAYLFTAGQLTQITVDHSLAEEKVRFGEMTPAEAAVHPHRHILTRALGVGDGVDVDLWELHLRTGDRLLLCSDGLTNEVPLEEIARVLSDVPEPEVVARTLVDSANRHGGNDNISVVVVDVLVGDDAVATPDVITARPPRSTPTPGTPSGPSDTGDLTGSTSAVGAQVTAPAGGPPPHPDAAPVSRTPAPAPGSTLVPTTASTPASTPGPPAPGPAGAPPGGSAQPVGMSPAPVGPPVVRAPAVAPRTPPAVGRNLRPETRRQRRRRLGVPRRLTFRVLGFGVLLAAVVAAAYFVVRWYATDNWYVTVRANELVVYQGRPGGLLWFEPKLVDRTGVSTSQVLAIHVPDLRANVQEPSLKAAKHYVADLVLEQASQQSGAGASATTTTGPAGTAGPVTTSTSPAGAP